MQTSTLSYQKIKDNLPHGALAEVAKKFNITQRYVTYILQGEKENNQVLEELVSRAEAAKKIKDELSQRIAAL